MRYLTLAEVLDLHARLITQSGGAAEICDLGALESAVAQPRASFAGQDLYETAVEKAAALGHALISNHPFIDGNKRVGHAAMEIFLLLNGIEIVASVDESEALILAVAAGEVSREQLTGWLRQHTGQSS